MNHYAVKVELDWHRIDTFMRSGHPRTVGILLGKSPNKDGLFAGVQITQLTVNGAPVSRSHGVSA